MKRPTGTTWEVMTNPTERAAAAQHTDCVDMAEVVAAYEVGLAAADGDQVAAAVLAVGAVLADRLDSIVRLLSTEISREVVFDDGRPAN